MEVSYEALVLLPPTSSASIEEAEDKLRTSYTNNECDVIIQRHETLIEIVIGDWICSVHFSLEPHVLEESQQMAEIFAATRPDKEEIATCNRRFEVIVNQTQTWTTLTITYLFFRHLKVFLVSRFGRAQLKSSDKTNNYITRRY